MAGPYIKPTVFSGEYLILKYDQTPINFFTPLSGNYTSSVAESKVKSNNDSYSFDRQRLFLESSEGLLPGPYDDLRISSLGRTMFCASAEDIMYNSDFYEVPGSSSIVRFEVAKRVPHIFSLQFSSVNNSRYIPLICRPFGASLGYNIKIFENCNFFVSNNGDVIDAVTGVHFHNPTYDSYMASKIAGILPEDREVGLGLPMFSKVYQHSPSSMRFCGAIRPFDFISTSGENIPFASEKGARSLADGAFWQGFIMSQDYEFNWSGIEGVHKIKQYNYISKDVTGLYSGSHKIQLGIDWYSTNTFDNAYLYRPDYVIGTEPIGAPGASALYCINDFKYWPSVTGTNLFGTLENKEYSGMMASGGVFNIQYYCNSSVVNPPEAYLPTYDAFQGLWHSNFIYYLNGSTGITVDQGKLLSSIQHPYASGIIPYNTPEIIPSGLFGGWNRDPAHPPYLGAGGLVAGQGKPYVCPIVELKVPNTFNTTDKVCMGIYTKLTPSPEVTNRANYLSVGNRREQIVNVWKKDIFYRPMTPETCPTPYAGTPPYGGTYPDFGPYTMEDLNGGAYFNIYSISNKQIKKGWYALEYWMIIAETKEQVISKINILHSMGAAEAGPSAPEVGLPSAVFQSTTDYTAAKTL